MFSSMMQSPTFVNIYYAGCASGAQKKKRDSGIQINC